MTADFQRTLFWLADQCCYDLYHLQTCLVFFLLMSDAKAVLNLQGIVLSSGLVQRKELYFIVLSSTEDKA